MAMKTNLPLPSMMADLAKAGVTGALSIDGRFCGPRDHVHQGEIRAARSYVEEEKLGTWLVAREKNLRRRPGAHAPRPGRWRRSTVRTDPGQQGVSDARRARRRTRTACAGNHPKGCANARIDQRIHRRSGEKVSSTPCPTSLPLRSSCSRRGSSETLTPFAGSSDRPIRR